MWQERSNEYFQNVSAHHKATHKWDLQQKLNLKLQLLQGVNKVLSNVKSQWKRTWREILLQFSLIISEKCFEISYVNSLELRENKNSETCDYQMMCVTLVVFEATISDSLSLFKTKINKITGKMFANSEGSNCSIKWEILKSNINYNKCNYFSSPHLLFFYDSLTKNYNNNQTNMVYVCLSKIIHWD